MKFINTIKAKDVYAFKESYCDENITISHLLNHNLKNYMKPPILDVGAGIGDIAFRAFEGKKVIMIDVNNVSKHDYPCRPNHIRKKVDFFEYAGKEQIQTILISHTLQFIDNDTTLLNDKVNEIGPENVVLVINKNDDFMEELITWTFRSFDSPNPEMPVENFPKGYNLVRQEPFTAILKCPDFETLAQQVAYLMLLEIESALDQIVSFLRRRLQTPQFIINQVIEVYKKI